MQFQNEKRGHVKIVRACSLVLAMLIMCSMLFVGNVTEFGASAAVSQNETLYIDVSNTMVNGDAWELETSNGTTITVLQVWTGS
ncbi:MAG: hypothetical protein II685_00785, partial [Clostridia bacterium]|nr:hypothetical protein [Clostridia bacterium]